LKKKVRAFISCLFCGATLEVNIKKSIEKFAILSGWTKVSIESLEYKEQFFLCPNCHIKLIEILRKMEVE
jgi:transcription elongation factor Elf1